MVVKEGSYAKAILLLRELDRTLSTPAVIKNLNRGVLNYIYAAGALAFACRDADVGSISNLLFSVHIQPQQDMLGIIDAMRYKSYMAHMNILYFMMAMGVEPTTEDVVAMLRAMDFKPDIESTGYTIEYFKEFSSGKIAYTLPEPEGDRSYVFNNTSAMVFSLSDLVSGFVITEIRKLLKDPRMEKHKPEEILYFLGAVGVLAFSGRDISIDGVSRILKAMSLEVNKDMLSDFNTIEIKNHVLYIVALYFLHALGKTPTIDNICEVVRAMDIKPNSMLAGYVVSYYKIASYSDT